jgi:BAI1-associated protein 3
LNVEIVEAKNLEAKDANGFSDPYCMLGIVPGHTDSSIIASDKFSSGTDDESPKMTGRKASKADVSSSFMRRFSSFGKSRKESSRGSKKSISSQGAIRDGKLPAKYIQTTDVKKATLNPVWLQKFRLYAIGFKNRFFLSNLLISLDFQ